jgi:hypothetical protein
MGKAHSSPPIRAKKSEVLLVLEGLMQIPVVPEDEDLRILFRRGTQPLPPALRACRAIQKLEEVPRKVGRVYYRGADGQVRTSSSSGSILRLRTVLCL